ncbi:ectoine/hydroxyectoine ABC transporter permease subunit EhuC [Paenibacillus sp.]|uniref:ectoine/hydroxyectoine ABC transporter permease subunit EhuC n=1 Tax=Paenibacillus sp. TaxID=58172 RepID=UPI002D681208|nr:ectoine/hydroxyectoine ABC transporter permease subunit EhuC [Paenibacillus sp.]HZG87610.1 ectoine/hydroxyectoine ABC transporter permease subunit EhuC [Paenibacillus sp.]
MLPAPFDLLPLFASGAIVTIQILVSSAVVAFVVSFLAGLSRLSKNRALRWFTTAYVETFRGSSLLVQMFWFFYAFPILFDVRSMPPFLAGMLAIGLNYGAYGSEVVRSAVQAVPKGQTEASIALNFTPLQRLRFIVLPQAFPMMLPSFGNLLIELLKSTSLVSLITIADMTFRANVLNNTLYRTEEIYIVLLLLYFAIAYPLLRFVRWYERRATAGR